MHVVSPRRSHVACVIHTQANKNVIVMSKLGLHNMCISVIQELVLAYAEFNGEQEKYLLFERDYDRIFSHTG